MKYVILTGDISGMGGGQKYCSNKVLLLSERGIKVIVISAVKGAVVLDNLKEYAGNIIPEILFPPNTYTKVEFNKTINWIVDIVGELDNESIIDSSNLACALWGEFIAKQYNCKSMCYFIDESFRIEPSDLDFLRFKLSRYELYGSSSKIIPMIFKDDSLDGEKYSFKPYCSNVVEDVPGDYKKESGRICICYFGRLDKGYIYKTLNESIAFFTSHPNTGFDVLMMGGTSNGAIVNDIKSLIKPINNVRLFITGYLYPIPRDMFNEIDICIASAGCINVSVREGTHTIAVNTITGKVTGVPGYTCGMDEDLRYGNLNIELRDLLEEMIYGYYFMKRSQTFPIQSASYNVLLREEMDNQFRQIKQCSEKEYYDIQVIKCDNWKSILFKIINTLFGAERLYKIRYEKYQRLVNMIEGFKRGKR